MEGAVMLTVRSWKFLVPDLTLCLVCVCVCLFFCDILLSLCFTFSWSRMYKGWSSCVLVRSSSSSPHLPHLPHPLLLLLPLISFREPPPSSLITLTFQLNNMISTPVIALGLAALVSASQASAAVIGLKAGAAVGGAGLGAKVGAGVHARAPSYSGAAGGGSTYGGGSVSVDDDHRAHISGGGYGGAHGGGMTYVRRSRASARGLDGLDGLEDVLKNVLDSDDISALADVSGSISISANIKAQLSADGLSKTSDNTLAYQCPDKQWAPPAQYNFGYFDVDTGAWVDDQAQVQTYLQGLGYAHLDISGSLDIFANANVNAAILPTGDNTQNKGKCGYLVPAASTASVDPAASVTKAAQAAPAAPSSSACDVASTAVPTGTAAGVLDVSATIFVALQANANANLGLSADVDADADADVNAGVDADVDANLDAQADVSVDVKTLLNSSGFFQLAEPKSKDCGC